LKDLPKSPQPVRLDGVFSYPKKAPNVVDSENAGPPPTQIEVRQAVVKVRPHGSAPSTAEADERRTADEDQMAAHILESMAERGEEVYDKKWPSVRAELTEHVKTMAIQGKLGDYTRGESKTINLTSVRGGKVVLGAHLDTMKLTDSNATTEFYSGGQQLLASGVSKGDGNNWQGFVQVQADLLPTGDTVNVSALARLGGGVGSETQDTRTNNTATGTLFRKKAPTETHVGTVTINADMSRPGGDGRIVAVGSAKVEFVTRESTTDKQAHASHVPRDGIIQNGTDGAASHGDEQGGPDDADLPRRGLSDKSIVRKLVDGENFRGVTRERLHERKIKDAGEVVDGLTDTLIASKLGDMTRVDEGDGIQLVRHGNVRIYGRAAVQKLDFARIEHEGGNAYVLNDVNQTRVDQHTATLEGNARLMFGPHGKLAPGVSASLLAGGGVGARGRVDAISSQAARVAANEKFARSHAVFDGATRITLTVRDGENRHELEPINIHGTILIPESETRPVDPPPPGLAPVIPAPKEEVPEEFWLGALAAEWADSGDEAPSKPPRVSLSAESHRSPIPAGSPIARTVDDASDVSRP
jgi:Tfp pilus assembly protein FimT